MAAQPTSSFRLGLWTGFKIYALKFHLHLKLELISSDLNVYLCRINVRFKQFF